jgi:formate dehydrogenase subunit gamma
VKITPVFFCGRIVTRSGHCLNSYEVPMRRVLIPASIAAIGMVATVLFAQNSPQIISAIGAQPSTTAWLGINNAFTGDWQQYGQMFTNFQSGLFNRIFLLILTIIPAVFLLHYIVIGAKHFDHNGPKVFFFSLFTRLIHLLAAISFSLLVITGLMVVFGKLLGGGAIVMTGRDVHLVSALIFTVTAVFMFLIWLKDMLPMPCDIAWLFILGGYLSKKKKPVPAGKFNAGQKMWFWLTTVGGGVMAYTGWYLYSFQTSTDQLRIMVMIHNFLGAALVALFLVHLYMSLFAISGSLRSMITGYKPLEEVEILHSRYKIQTSQTKPEKA